MLNHIDISGIKLELTDDFKKYTRRKIGRLDRYLPRHARKSAHGEVKVREVNQEYGNKYECEVILHVPGDILTAKEATMNMFAAIDIIEQKIKNQLKRYKTIHEDHRGKHAFLSRFKRRGTADSDLTLEEL